MERIQKYINRIYRAAVLDRAGQFEEIGLSGTLVSYILQLVRHPGLNQDELSRKIFVDKSSVARQIRWLKEKGFVDRQIDPEDNRKRLLFPTQKAQAAYVEIEKYLDDWNLVLMEQFSEEEYEDIVDFLRKLAKAASQATKTSLDEMD